GAKNDCNTHDCEKVTGLCRTVCTSITEAFSTTHPTGKHAAELWLGLVQETVRAQGQHRFRCNDTHSTDRRNEARALLAWWQHKGAGALPPDHRTHHGSGSTGTSHRSSKSQTGCPTPGLSPNAPSTK